MRGHVLERLAEIHVPVNKRMYVCDELRLTSIYSRLARKQDNLTYDEIIARQEGYELRVGSDIDRILQRPPTRAVDRKQRLAQVRPVHHLNDHAVIQNSRRRRHDPLLILIVAEFHAGTVSETQENRRRGFVPLRVSCCY